MCGTHTRAASPRIAARSKPHPLSIGGLIEWLFFSAKDPNDPKQVEAHILRLLTLLSPMLLLGTLTALEALGYAAEWLQEMKDIHGSPAT